MSEHTPEHRNFRAPFFIRDCPHHREIRDADGRFIAMSQNSGAPHIDAELVEVLKQMAAAPLLVEACKEALAWLDCPPNRSPPGITQKLSAALAAVGE